MWMWCLLISSNMLFWGKKMNTGIGCDILISSDNVTYLWQFQSAVTLSFDGNTILKIHVINWSQIMLRSWWKQIFYTGCITLMILQLEFSENIENKNGILIISKTLSKQTSRWSSFHKPTLSWCHCGFHRPTLSYCRCGFHRPTLSCCRCLHSGQDLHPGHQISWTN